MDQLDILENSTALFFSIFPLLGIMAKERLIEIVFANTEFGFEDTQKNEIFDRFEFISLLLAYLATIQGMLLCLIAYFHTYFWLVFAIVIVGLLGIGFITWLWGLGATRFNLLPKIYSYLICSGPVLILIAKIVIIISTVGIEVEEHSICSNPDKKT